ncbi:MAG: phosphoenolpyruvate--protein phosphotransferase [Planctomycetota bacterium]
MPAPRPMTELRGLPVSGGSRVGYALLFEEVPDVRAPAGGVGADDVPAELARLDAALEEALAQLEGLQASMEGQAGLVSGIFEAHAAMLNDAAPRLRAAVQEGNAAEHAVAMVLHAIRERLEALPNPVFAQRAQDIVDIERRLLRALGSLSHETPDLAAAPLGPVVVVASTLTPSEVAAFEGREIAAMVLEYGGPTSHSVLIAKSLGIPCVVGVMGVTRAVHPGDRIWVDGSEGLVVIAPDAEMLERARGLGERYDRLEAALLRESNLPAETLDGYRASLLANVEFRPDVEAGVARGAEGVGLYRTEFLVDERGRLPTEEEQLETFRWTLERLRGGALTIRTYDFGSDKPEVPNRRFEPNSALGERSLRWCFAHPEPFRAQLRALLRVAAEGDVRIMLPMVGGLEELRLARRALAAASAELAREGVAHRPDPPLGVMVEIPAAALIADLLAKEADFLSIGTNDLIQYGLAVDRLNPAVARWFRPSHPALLRMIRTILDAAAVHRTPVTMCGEMGGQSIYTVLLFGMGVRAFSLTPGYLPRARRLLRSLTARDARSLAAACLRQTTADDVEALLKARVQPVGRG